MYPSSSSWAFVVRWCIFVRSVVFLGFGLSAVLLPGGAFSSEQHPNQSVHDWVGLEAAVGNGATDIVIVSADPIPVLATLEVPGDLTIRGGVLDGGCAHRILEVVPSGTFTAFDTMFRTVRAHGAAHHGGAISDEGTLRALRNAIFHGDSARSGGGALYNDGDVGLVINTAFSQNEASSRGAIFNTGHFEELSARAFASNIASDSGGAIANWGSSGSVAQNIFAHDCAGGLVSSSRDGAMYTGPSGSEFTVGIEPNAFVSNTTNDTASGAVHNLGKVGTMATNIFSVNHPADVVGFDIACDSELTLVVFPCVCTPLGGVGDLVDGPEDPEKEWPPAPMNAGWHCALGMLGAVGCGFAVLGSVVVYRQKHAGSAWSLHSNDFSPPLPREPLLPTIPEGENEEFEFGSFSVSCSDAGL
jgi:hypothetical protein